MRNKRSDLRPEGVKTQRVCVYGIVQGVGFRPFVSRIADAAGVKGSVANKGSYVEIFVQGPEEARAAFMKALRENPPERSAVLKIDVEDLTTECQEVSGDDSAEFSKSGVCSQPQPVYDSFEIIESEAEEGDIFVSPDIATCPKCKRELYDKNNRRYMHPFINCTACGPRVTILDAMPYDRERTSMKEFPMCPECEWEYTHAETRRYDAQPVCCNDCGPEVYLVGKNVRGRAAITASRQAIMDGQIVAIKGIGGFHLCCDATNEEAVARLRSLKRRPAKPFAVMMRDLEAVRRVCKVGQAEEEILDGHQKPIILLEKKAGCGKVSGSGKGLAPSVAPDNPKVGVMLPYAPVQMLLFDYDDGLEMTTDCFVMTSGNVSGAPICRTDEDAISELSGFCDIILSHNRKIRLRADDSVMNFYKNEPYMIRRSRGYAPLPLMMSDPMFSGQVLAVGGELKNTFCIGKEKLLYPSPYVGDMADLRTVRALSESIVRMEELLETKPSVVVCDLHPKYNTTVVAKEQGLPVVQVQHHYAHILSCMAENNYMKPVIGVSFDGTGYGTDGTIWGGELMVADVHGFTRAGSIMPFMQVGGDASAKEGWRIAASMINALFDGGQAGEGVQTGLSDQVRTGEQVGLGSLSAGEIAEKLGLCNAKMAMLIKNMAARKINSVTSTSAGRLFDAVSAILGVRKMSTFEGEASTTLMFRAEAYTTSGGKSEAVLEQELDEFCGSSVGEMNAANDHEKVGGCAGVDACEIESNVEKNIVSVKKFEDRFVLATDQLVKKLVLGALDGADTNYLAYMFHGALARQIAAGCKTIASETGLDVVALSGGVFQNQLLLELCEKYLGEMGLQVLRHHLIPPNDGGLCVGQAVAGYAWVSEQK